MEFKQLTTLTVKTVLFVFVAETILNGVLEVLGRENHQTETWIAALIGSVITLVVGASFRKKD